LNGILKGTWKDRLLSWCTGNFLDKHLKIELNNNTSLIKVITVIKVQLEVLLVLIYSKLKCGVLFQWYTSPTEINQLAGRNPLRESISKIILVVLTEVSEYSNGI
jgi:iron complex outermembrane receptor protein